MKAIKTFFSLAILFVFVYLVTLVLFTVDVFLRPGLYSFQLYSGLDLYLEVLLYSFPLALVISCVVCLYMLIKSGSLSSSTFFLTFFAIAFLGFGGIHYFAQDILLEEKEDQEIPYEQAFEIYQGKDAFFLFRARSGELIKDVMAISTVKPLGAFGFYPEGIWSETDQTLKLIPTSKRDTSLVIERYFAPRRLVNQDYKSNLQFLLMDVYYISYFFMSLPFLAFLFNLIGFLCFTFSLAHFTTLFSRMVAVMMIVGMGRLIFFLYRLFIFDMTFIVQDFGLLSPTALLYFPFTLCMLASASLMGTWQLISNRNAKSTEKS